MNSRFRSLTVVIAAASLVGLAQAQSSTGSSSTSTGASRSTATPSTSSTSTSPSSSQSSSSTMRDSTSMDRPHSMSSTAQGSALGSTGAGSLQVVTKKSLEQQITAKGLIGKDVHDSSGEKIGEVEDIVLDSSSLPELASAFMSREADSAATRAGVASSTGARATTDTSSATATRSDVSAAGRSALDQAGAMASSAMSAGPAAVVSAGGMLGLGQDLIRVPLSQLRYDASEDRVTLNVTREQISSLTESDTSSRVAE